MISAGETAPDFEAPSSSGGRLRLSSLKGRPVVLYFFPKAFTPGCTAETNGFAGRYPELRARGVEVVGVSVDTAPTQEAFARSCHAEFPLVADPDKSIARSYGVLGLLGMARRVTFVIDRAGVVRAVVDSMRPSPHLLRAVEETLRLG